MEVGCGKGCEGIRKFRVSRGVALRGHVTTRLCSCRNEVDIFISSLHNDAIRVNTSRRFRATSAVGTFVLTILCLRTDQNETSLRRRVACRTDRFISNSKVLQTLNIKTGLGIGSATAVVVVYSSGVTAGVVVSCLKLSAVGTYVQRLNFKRAILRGPLRFSHCSGLNAAAPQSCTTLFTRITGNALIDERTDTTVLNVFHRRRCGAVLARSFPRFCLSYRRANRPRLV